jgi:O-antigen ligase
MGLLFVGARDLLPMRRIAGVACVSAIVIGLWGISLTVPRVEEDAVTYEEFVSHRVTNVRTVEFRIKAWLLLLPTIAEHALWGLGFGNSPDYLAAQGVRPGEGIAHNAHSSYFSILFEAGTVAFATFLAIQAVIIRRGTALVKSPGDEHVRWLGFMLLALTLAYSIPGIPEQSFYRATIGNFVYYALVGCILSLGARNDSGRDPHLASARCAAV